MSADWEKAAETYLSADDFQAMKALAEAFTIDRAAGVNSRLVPASAPDTDNRPFCDCHEEYGQNLVAALEWYGEQARLCRLIHSEGDAGRHALSNDGGRLAREALAALEPKR